MENKKLAGEIENMRDVLVKTKNEKGKEKEIMDISKKLDCLINKFMRKEYNLASNE